MSQQRLKRLLSKRSAKGNFNTFSDILEIDGLGIKLMEKMCDSILNFDSLEHKNVKDKKIKKATKGKILEPCISRKKIESIKTATAIYVNANMVSWAQIEKDTFSLIAWNFYIIDSADNKKLQLSEIMQIVRKFMSIFVWDILKLLPKSDLYVMESPLTMFRSVGADAKNPKTVHVNLQKAQFIAVLSTAINIFGNFNSIKPDGEDFDHKLIYLRAALSSRLYRMLIGNEIVSAEATVINILEHNENAKIYHSNRLNVSNEIKQLFNQENDINKEILSQTLLLGLAFFEVCVFENPRAIEKLTSNSSD